MLEPEPPTCESYTQTWSLERLLRVVCGPGLLTYQPTIVLNRHVFCSCYPRVHSTMGVYGCHSQIRKPKVFAAFGEPCSDDRLYALAAWRKAGCQSFVWFVRTRTRLRLRDYN